MSLSIITKNVEVIHQHSTVNLKKLGIIFPKITSKYRI